MAENSSEFKPYIPADKITPEFTITSILTGIILAIVFGAANAYLGLRVGMTISASIPAAVIAMGISLITLCGAILGVLFMIPLRNSIIVQEHGILPYPEAQACAEVLLAGEKKGSDAKAVFSGMGIAAAFKFIIDGIKAVESVIAVPLKAFKTEFSAEIYPAVIGVGYICGYRISSFLFAGGLLAWFVMIPLIVAFGGNTVLFPSDIGVSELYAAGGAGAIWSKYVRYIGAGALAAAGIISLNRHCCDCFCNLDSSSDSGWNRKRAFDCCFRIFLCNCFFKNGWSCWFF